MIPTEELRNLKPSRVERILSQERILLMATATKVPGLPAALRLAGDDVETATRAIQTFILLRKVLMDIKHQTDRELPLQQPTVPLALRDQVLLSDFVDIIACNVISKNRQGQLVQVK